MEKKQSNDQICGGVAASTQSGSINNWGIKDEIIAGYNSIKGCKFAGSPMFVFNWKDGIKVFIEKDYGMWCVSVYRDWESRLNPGEVLLDRRAFNLTDDYKTMKWSGKVIDKAVELIESVIAE